MTVDHFVCFDLGDTIMVEETEEKDETRTTQRAELIPGLADLIRSLHQQGVMLGIVADTRPGTYRNVLLQHNLYGLFSVFSISEELGVEKPHPLMFTVAVGEAKRQGYTGNSPVMIGNNYARDIVGGKQAGFVTCWFHWNDRYPVPTDASAADGVVTSAADLRLWLDRWFSTDSAKVAEA